MQELFSHLRKSTNSTPPANTESFILDAQNILGDNDFGYKLKPFQLVSLLEMIQISLARISAMTSLLTEFESKLSLLSKSYPMFTLHRMNHKKLTVETMKTLLEETISVIDEIGLHGTKRLANAIVDDLEKILVVNLADSLKKLQTILKSELSEKLVMYIPTHNAWWFNNESSFGLGVKNAFPSATEDIVEAGNCYAVDRPTACVFHSMRILEHGLRTLAQDVGLTFDIQQWHNIIEQIESKIKEERKLPKSIEKDKRLQFLSEVAKEFMYFKDGWRNYVMHNRTDYDIFQAYSVFSHVQSFMQHLSTQLKEEI
jgi:hypothetical protein